MLDHRLAGGRIEHRLAGQRIDHRLLEVLEVDVAGLEAVAWLAHPAGGEEGVLGEVVVRGGLLEHVGVQPQQPLVAPHRREHVGVEHRADVVRHVVVHPVGVDRPLALAEDDVPFEVEFQRRPLVLEGRPAHVQPLQAAGPDHHAVGRDVDRAHVADPRKAAAGVDDHVHAGVDPGDLLVGVGIGAELAVDGDVAAGEDADPPHPAGRRRNRLRFAGMASNRWRFRRHYRRAARAPTPARAAGPGIGPVYCAC